ncbi:family 20 glycosylhydrolase [Dysgonomonas sp. 511]|uniref:family 20 glycosylhydrolase n=1 Tax=Dysgonomonas sp. 511 TaxID=2302930 RepID=UPI0013D102D3|nr:family 20 glycosylhydrolase [Dysgonomonas sp. 511]NDV79311.1 beta-hexosaminidase [Dysgonomonas sp. 511]
MKKNILIVLFIIACMFKLQASNNPQLPIIPYPSNIQTMDGNFILNGETSVSVVGSYKFENEISYLQSLVKSVIGKDITISNNRGNNKIEFKYNPALVSDEAYMLEVNSAQITISAKAGQGAFYAIQTLSQIMNPDPQGFMSFPNLKIEDSPAFKWRGMHLDISRHFFNMEYIKKHIDRLSFYKFNKLHLHLTDDQGWRIEIKQYPKLTTEGAWRTLKNKHDSICIERSKENPNFEIDSRFIHEKDGVKVYGGFYTQEQMKELIAYARERHVEIIPEVDMPGHMMAAIKSYPFLVDGDAGWGELFSTPICPCKEDVYTFTKNVLAEIIDLFPSKYIHIGADEVDKETWEKSELCKEFMQKHNLEDVSKLQSYFVHEMQSFVESKGKKIIAWDEILQGGTNPDVTVMYWRGWVKGAPLEAVNNGNEVIMTPTNPLYFDYANNNTSVYNVYTMNVIYPEIPEDKRSLIQGAQANLWAEYIPTEQQADFQMYPRMLALAERVWTDDTKHFDAFYTRLLKHFPKLDAMGVHYRLPDIEGFALENVYVGSTRFLVQSPLPGMKIHYTLDGSTPQHTSPILESPVSISTPTALRMALFSPGGARGEIYNLNFKPSDMKVSVSANDTQSGLLCGFFDKKFKNTKEIASEVADETFVVANIKAPKETKSFGLVFNGYIDVPETGIYSFFFTCDDGGVLYIDNEMVIDNDGLHSAILKSGQAAMQKGLHPFKLDFVEGGGGYTLRLQYSFNGSAPRDIPDNWFRYAK